MSGQSCASLNLSLVGLHSEQENDAVNLIIGSFLPLQDTMKVSGIFIGKLSAVFLYIILTYLQRVIILLAT